MLLIKAPYWGFYCTITKKMEKLPQWKNYYLRYFEFEEHIKGSHHVYYKEEIDEIINLQTKGYKVKSYQVRNLILKYKLGDGFDI